MFSRFCVYIGLCAGEWHVVALYWSAVAEALYWSAVAEAFVRNAAPLGPDGRSHIRLQFEAHRLQPTAQRVTSAAVTFLSQERQRPRSYRAPPR
jgi:hypothetical protein